MPQPASSQKQSEKGHNESPAPSTILNPDRKKGLIESITLHPSKHYIILTIANRQFVTPDGKAKQADTLIFELIETSLKTCGIQSISPEHLNIKMHLNATGTTAGDVKSRVWKLQLPENASDETLTTLVTMLGSDTNIETLGQDLSKLAPAYSSIADRPAFQNPNKSGVHHHPLVSADDKIRRGFANDIKKALGWSKAHHTTIKQPPTRFGDIPR